MGDHRAKAERVTEQTDVPLDAAVVFGVGTSDLHVWRASPMTSTVDEHLGTVPLTRVAGASMAPGDSWSMLTITLDGGDAIECSARGDVAGFVDALS